MGLGCPPHWAGARGLWGHIREPALTVSLLFSSSEFGAPVSVPVQEILDVICRTLSISAKNIVSGTYALFSAPSQTLGGQESSVGDTGYPPRLSWGSLRLSQYMCPWEQICSWSSEAHLADASPGEGGPGA